MPAHLTPNISTTSHATTSATSRAISSAQSAATLPSTRGTIVGAPHVSSMGRETIARFADFDRAVVGEGEFVLREIL